MRRVSLLAPCIVTIAALGCGSAGVVPNGGGTHSVILSGQSGGSSPLQYFDNSNNRSDFVAIAPAVLWPKLGTIYSRLSIPVTTVDTVNHVLGASRATVRGRIGEHPVSYALTCGDTEYGTPRANNYSVTLTVLTQLAPSGSGSKVTSVVSGFAQDQSLSSSAVQCSSTGALEGDIVHALAAP